MAAQNLTDIGFNGFSFVNGSGAPSVSHNNGRNGDIFYLRRDKSGAVCWLDDVAQFDVARQTTFNNDLNYYGWGVGGFANLMLSETFTRGGVPMLLPHTRHFHKIAVPAGAPAPNPAPGSYDSADVVAHQDLPQTILATGNLATVGTVTRHGHHLHLQGYDVTTIETINSL
jgi:hypothetical protein